MQQNTKVKSFPDDLNFYKQEVKKLQSKLTEYEKKIKLLDKQQDKINELQKINFDTSTRLLQCVSNVRDLLHSNKQLRFHLEEQKKSKQQILIHVKNLQKKLSLLHKNNGQQNQDQKQSNFIKNRPKNIHRLTKIQKFTKNHLTEPHKITQNIQFLQSSPIKRGLSILIKWNENQNYRKSQNQSKFQGQQREKRKLIKSQDQKVSFKDYEKAQMRRKLSLRKSQNRLQILQYKP